MTLAQLLTQLQQLLHEHPDTADYSVRLVPHGRSVQELATIHLDASSVVLLEGLR